MRLTISLGIPIDAMPVSTVLRQSRNCHGSLKRSRASSFFLCRDQPVKPSRLWRPNNWSRPTMRGQASSAAAVCLDNGRTSFLWFFALCSGRNPDQIAGLARQLRVSDTADFGFAGAGPQQQLRTNARSGSTPRMPQSLDFGIAECALALRNREARRATHGIGLGQVVFAEPVQNRPKTALVKAACAGPHSAATWRVSAAMSRRRT